MRGRPKLFVIICGLVGPAVCTPVDPGKGWPGVADVITSSGAVVRVAMHVSPVGSHSRAAYEMRFQNPADSAPVTSPHGAVPILVGLASVGVQQVLVALDAASRVGRKARFSILFRDDILKSAAANGWAEYQSKTGERMFAFHPKLLGIFVEALQSGVFPNSDVLAQASIASGLVQDNTEAAAKRTRVVASRLVRDARFSKDVRAAYEERCAMCGLSLELVVGAHILPASAPLSQDKVWNGLSLCHNHHAAFDKHLIWVEPNSHDVKIHPDILATADTDAAAKIFIENTRSAIIIPTEAASRPRAGMFTQRYDYFENKYEWA